jgi:hypothetical protein
MQKAKLQNSDFVNFDVEPILDNIVKNTNKKMLIQYIEGKDYDSRHVFDSAILDVIKKLDLSLDMWMYFYTAPLPLKATRNKSILKKYLLVWYMTNVECESSQLAVAKGITEAFNRYGKNWYFEIPVGLRQQLIDKAEKTNCNFKEIIFWIFHTYFLSEERGGNESEGYDQAIFKNIKKFSRKEKALVLIEIANIEENRKFSRELSERKLLNKRRNPFQFELVNG